MNEKIWNLCESENLTLLHLAISDQEINKVKILLEDPQTEINHTNNAGWTCLHIAAEVGNPEIFELLLRNGPLLNINEERFGYSPFHIAASCGHIEIIRLLIEAGATLSLKDKFNRAPFELAQLYKQRDVADLISKTEKRTLSILEQSDPDIDVEFNNAEKEVLNLFKKLNLDDNQQLYSTKFKNRKISKNLTSTKRNPLEELSINEILDSDSNNESLKLDNCKRKRDQNVSLSGIER